MPINDCRYKFFSPINSLNIRSEADLIKVLKDLKTSFLRLDIAQEVYEGPLMSALQERQFHVEINCEHTIEPSLRIDISEAIYAIQHYTQHSRKNCFDCEHYTIELDEDCMEKHPVCTYGAKDIPTVNCKLPNFKNTKMTSQTRPLQEILEEI